MLNANIANSQASTPAIILKKMHTALFISLMIVSTFLTIWTTQTMGAAILTPESEFETEEFSISLDQDGQAIAAVNQGPVKWHPGHYIMLVNPGKESDWYMNQIYNELETHPAMRGIAVRFQWAELEKSKGVYDFSLIDKLLTQLAARKKRLIILVEVKSFKANEIRVPKYLQTAEYDGGIFPHGSGGVIKGYNIKLWNQNVYLRFAALVSAMGKHLNAHPYFEGLGQQETAMGNPIKPLTSTQTNTYFANLLKINQQMRNSFPNTMSFQYTNYPRGILKSFVTGLKEMGATLGCPDIFIQEPGLNFPGSKNSPKGIYPYFTELSGILPLAVQVEQSNYENTRHDGSGYQPTITELLNFAKQNLKVNYIFWTRSPGYYDDVMAMLRQKAQTSNPSGGLQATCPTSFASCNTN